jgi:hypothetical protein
MTDEYGWHTRTPKIRLSHPPIARFMHPGRVPPPHKRSSRTTFDFGGTIGGCIFAGLPAGIYHARVEIFEQRLRSVDAAIDCVDSLY